MAAGLSIGPRSASAAPFISEILLPASGHTAVEVDGLGSAGATLLIVNASRERLKVQHAITLPPAGQTVDGLGLAFVAGNEWATNPAAAPLPPGAISRDHALFSDLLPVSLVLIEGQSVISEDVSLGNGGAVSGISPANPIVDWVSFAVGTDAQAQALIQSPNAASVAALGIADLPRPAVGTTGITALARALTRDGPVMHTLLGGNAAGFDADPLGLSDFLLSPGQRNPLTAAGLDDNEDEVVPEPAAAVWLLGGGLWFFARRRGRA